MRPRTLLLVLAVAIAAAFLVWFVRRPKTPAVQPTASTATAPTASSQRALQLAIQHDGLTPERATTLFSLTVGPLPGVSIAGLAKDPSDVDGTEAVLYVLERVGGAHARATPGSRRADSSAGARAGRPIGRPVARGVVLARAAGGTCELHARAGRRPARARLRVARDQCQQCDRPDAGRRVPRPARRGCPTDRHVRHRVRALDLMARAAAERPEHRRPPSLARRQVPHDLVEREVPRAR